jgi:hypothetical protein
MFCLFAGLLARISLFSFLSVTPFKGSQDVDILKGKTVVFILPSTEYFNIDDYKKMLPQAWTLTPIEVIKYSEAASYPENDKYLFFAIRGDETRYTGRYSNMDFHDNQYYLTLSPTYVQKKKSKDEYCRIDLDADVRMVHKKPITERVYENSNYGNFSVPYMMSYLRYVQKNLINKKNPTRFQIFSNKELRERLATDTLYVPRYSYDPKKTAPYGKDTDVFDSYKGIYKVVSSADLMDMVKNQTSSKPLFVFEYVEGGADRYVGVIDITSGTVVYRKQRSMGKLKSADIREIIN